MSTINRAVAEANRAVNQAIRDTYATRTFQIVRFGRHRDGYLHAQVTLDGAPIYVHAKFGSWLIPREPQSDTCPVQFSERASLREVVAPYTFALSEAARKFIDTQRKEASHGARGPESDGGHSRADGGGATAEAA